ncbi:hypothetical protein [Clostridium cylindrosporum]|uniref:Uncharacterized protein n=1 Tax=Clostridium cylindrosporum DSM 605 TaxID=1121307 RepID=A0A0J8DBT1_CLOCY|nr:hypothetical protein [Clostridium cylindrosporum]KMT21769.1 hypothetical protein CLCY_3c00360 [Clostridium cylindrosporum DSM 605]
MLSIRNLVFVLVGTIILFMMIYLIAYTQPKITFISSISTLDKQSYDKLAKKQETPRDKNIENFKDVEILLKIDTPILLIKELNIDRSYLESYLMDNPRIKVLDAKSSGNPNSKKSQESLKIHLNNISENELKNYLKDFKIAITWKDIVGNKNKQILYVTDHLN